MNIRVSAVDDLPILAEYWYDRMALLSQKTAMIRLMPDAQARWQKHAQSLLTNDDATCLTVELDGEILGCMFASIQANKVGLLPEFYGKISDIVLDLHSPHRQAGTVKALLQEMKQHFQTRDLSVMMVQVPLSATIEQAFWEGLGAKHYQNTFWMEI